MTLEGARLKVRNAYIKYTADQRRKILTNDCFTIISNNCWGGVVYESYGLQKCSPTVGLYFAPEEYLRFVTNIRHYINNESLSFVLPDSAKHKELYRQDDTFGEYPIARLGDIEIAMLHYRSQEEAKDKWERRCSRINWDKLIIKMNDQNGCTYDDMISFIKAELNCNKKLFFTSHKDWMINDQSLIYIPQFSSKHVFASMEPFGASRICNVNELINSI